MLDIITFKDALMSRLIILENEMTSNATDALVAGDKKTERKFNDMACGVAAAIAEVMRELDDKRWSSEQG